MTSRRILSLALALAGAAVLAIWGSPFPLQFLGYVPILVVGWIRHDPHAHSLVTLFGDPAVLRAYASLLVAVALFAGARRVWPARHLLGSVPTHRLRRWLTITTGVAVACPLVYATTRIAWALGIPVGISPAFLLQIQPIVRNGAVLAAGAVVGALLTVGLARPWGTRFPRWVPCIGGRAVPVALPRIAGLGVAFCIAAAGAYFTRAALTGADLDIAPSGTAGQTAAWLPELSWPLWAVALACAVTVYGELRRRNVGSPA